ncbi:hypothetical protein OROGR_008593 [Orobanche gracilis]
MSRYSSFSRPTGRNTPTNENEFKNSCNQIPSRAPLISITDPSQCQSKTPLQQLKHDFKEVAESCKTSSSKKPDGNTETRLFSSLVRTHKACGRNKPINSEPNSDQRAPIRSGPSACLASAASGCAFSRSLSQLDNDRGRGGIVPRVSRGISLPIPQLFSADVPDLELDEDPSFWKGHNVQVLIRIRPLNSTEVISQGYGRCLRQENAETLVWIGQPETRFAFDHIACEGISQELLGGNSKTTIVANVSPSICSTNETCTSKFAQCAKLIQNNSIQAKINEDALGTVIALQQQIQQLKDHLSLLMKHQHTSMEQIDFVPRVEEDTLGHFSESYEPYEEINMLDEHKTPKGVVMKKNHLEATLHGALRRPKLAETEVGRLRAEIEHLNLLQAEETRHSKMMLKFREEKIKRLELLVDGLISSDKFYLDENNALREENLLLQEKIRRNAEVNHFAPNDLSGHGVIYDKNDCNMDYILNSQHENAQKQLMDAQFLIETMKMEQFQLIKELESVQSANQSFTRMLDTMEFGQRKIDDYNRSQSGSGNQDIIVSVESSKGTGTLPLQIKLENLTNDLTEAHILNRRFLEDHETRLSQDHQTELVCSEVQMETTRTTLQLQEEIYRLQLEFQECLCTVTKQNISLRNSVANKEDELRESCAEWERATLDLTTFLINGSRSLRDASREIESISSSFPNVSDRISEHVERAAKKCVEQEETILLLQKNLEDAQNTMMQMEQKLFILKGATIALTEYQQPEKCTSLEGTQLSRMPIDLIGVEEKGFPENSLPVTTLLTDNQATTHIFVENRIPGYASVVRNPPLAYTNAFVEKNPQHDEVQFSLRETANILSLLEECFLTMQTRMDELSQTAFTDAFQVVEKVPTLCRSLRSSLEDLICKAMQNDISTLVIQCQMVELSLKVRRLNTISNPGRPALQEQCLVADDILLSHVSQDGESTLQYVKSESKGHQIAGPSRNEKDLNLFGGCSVEKNSELMRELTRKDVLLKGLLFDFSLLQEFAAHRKDIKDELERLILAMGKVQHELQTKTVQLDDILIQNTRLKSCLYEAEKALYNSNSELDQAKEALHILSEQNVELKDLLKNLYLKNSEAEQLLEDQKEAIKSLEREIIRVSLSTEKRVCSSVDNLEDALAEVVAERDQLVENLTCLQDKLDMASALADENQAIAAEARQESETCKLYAEQKEEEVKILERSVQELESTINVLEKKVHEMEEEVEKQGMLRDSLELELQSLRNRLLTVEDFTESMTSENSSTTISEDHLSRSLEIQEAHSRIRFLEEANRKQAKEIRQFKDYICELVLHAEAQASQYQQKYQTLEAMIHEVKTDVSNVSTASTLHRPDKISARTRGSSSPFRCIAGLVQQMNQEKDQELSSARLRIEELEELAANRYKEVCVLNTRLATVESMTHDVIRDLLSVKLDISNYADIVDHQQLQKLIEEAQHHRQDFVAMNQEILYLRNQIEDLLEERERCISEINRSRSDQLNAQIALEQFQEQDQMLIAQNDMLKRDKHNLQKRIAELNDMVKRLFSIQDTSEPCNQPQMNSLSRPFDYGLGGRLAQPQKVLPRTNNQLAQYRRPEGVGTDEKANKAKLKRKN